MEMIIKALWKDGLQTRVALDEATVCEYAEAMRNGDQFPPVKVFEEPCAGAYYLADGFHRVEAAMRAGRDTVEADVQLGTFTDALRYALGCNAKHGKRVTNEDKRRAMELAWENRADLFGGDPSAALLAQTCGVHRNTAQQFLAEHFTAPAAPKMPVRQAAAKTSENQRAQAIDGDEVAHFVQPATAPTMPVRRVGTDGKNYPVRPARPAPVKAPAHLVPTDRYGVEIPVGLGAAFGKDLLADVLASISSARSAIRKEQEAGNPQFAAIRQQALVELDNAYNFVAAATPFCVCRMCQGQGCKACGGRGWQTEEQYDRNPSDFKAEEVQQ